MPKNEHPRRYPDMELNKLIGSIETEGVRFAWTRAADCPCVGNNPQTRQPDPNCPLCHGLSVFYFGPENYVPPAAVGTLTSLQKAILAVDGAVVIKGVMAKATQEFDLYDVLGRWYWGAMMVTVRPENKIGYYDRLVNLDTEVVYYQTVHYVAPAPTIPLRYRATAVNIVRSDTTIYREGQHFQNINGILTWIPTQVPSMNLNLSVHYQMHPTWVVMDHPHAARETGIRRKAPASVGEGLPTPLPIQGHVRLEFLPVPGGAP